MTAKPENRLLEVHSALTPDNRDSLLSFAEFLLSSQPADQTAAEETPPTPLAAPLEFPRPDSETVVGAIRRLRETYPMIPRKAVFQHSSTLMTRHIVEGTDTVVVVDELEALFLSEYNKLKAGDEPS